MNRELNMYLHSIFSTFHSFLLLAEGAARSHPWMGPARIADVT